NASFHRKKRLHELAEEYNVKIVFLPPYSPELNPIEHFWYWLKKKSMRFVKIF
ncbi:MAG: transposase, partial [Synergistaceae bacterium]|nr:transposase [Synergistaceae bacterium]